jgi:AraC-like DNA-binding protein
MAYCEFIPGRLLQPYVKCYYLYESDTSEVFEDKAFATGCMEIMFNLGSSRWQTVTGNSSTTTPLIELWGQVIDPLTFRSLGKNIMFGARFFPHTAAIFLQQHISEFNNQVVDYTDVADKSVLTLYEQLLEAGTTGQRIELLEAFLLNSLGRFEKKLPKITLIDNVMTELQRDDFFDNIKNVAARYGITSRYLQKLFLQHTGLTPKLYSKINRFQHSLALVSRKNSFLTEVAYECGYFDQSHFIREFKSFTGVIPSAFNNRNVYSIFATPTP